MQSSSGNYLMRHQVPMMFLLPLVYLSAAACISGGTKFGRIWHRNIWRVKVVKKKKSLENSKNRQILSFTEFVDAIHKSVLSI